MTLPGTTLTMSPLDPATEAEIIHAWVVDERARFWMMLDHTLEEVREIYQWIADQPTHEAYLVRRAGEPIALFQTYDPRAEEIGGHYDWQPGDVGVHLMMGPIAEPVPGLTAQVMDFCGEFVFADPDAQRIVAEPDAENEKLQTIVDARGGERGGTVALEKKVASLVFITRDLFAAVRLY